ncbi:MAG: HypC/HybG/HupF family hydrogenase formation chaperone [Deltaproteobacteria bacterium]|nr:HypC/HybG/HupF family hydrogenase formation chaperone [Deltaproteobacteria bacterium]MCB9489141.1 HypC/HybG/HupF family hydrogenase formation chaperone [Deltaproteobacteria bacterium]
MCLAVPMRVIEAKADGRGRVELDGALYDVDLSLIEDVHPGEHVIVHAGFAIEKLDEAEADARLALFDELARTYERESGQRVRLAAPAREETS